MIPRNLFLDKFNIVYKHRRRGIKFIWWVGPIIPVRPIIARNRPTLTYPTRLGLHSVRKQGAVPPMAVALVNPRAPAGRAIGFLLRSLDTIKSASVVPSPSLMNAGDPKKKKNLFGVAQFLPNWGIGYKMAKTHWRDASFEIAKVNLHKEVSSLHLVVSPSPLALVFSFAYCFSLAWFLHRMDDMAKRGESGTRPVSSSYNPCWNSHISFHDCLLRPILFLLYIFLEYCSGTSYCYLLCRIVDNNWNMMKKLAWVKQAIQLYPNMNLLFLRDYLFLWQQWEIHMYM